jgi:hypothetical protein
MTQAAILAASGSPGTTTGFKNKLINGNFMISQYNGSSAVTPTSDSTYFIDRYYSTNSQASKLTFQQNGGSVTPPAGFANYLGTSVAATATVGTGDYFGFSQRIEGFNTSDLAWGTANAKTVTLSFWVYSNTTGTFGGSLTNGAFNYSYPFTYTISAANTWQQISITIAGPTAGTWVGATNGIGLRVYWSIGCGSSYQGTAGTWTNGVGYLAGIGSTSLMGSTSNYFYITGVQLEVGTTATNFDFRSIGTELGLCQRYYQTVPFTGVPSVSGYGGWAFLQNPQLSPTMRAAPTVTYNAGAVYYPGAVAFTPTTDNSSTTAITIINSAGGGGNAYYVTWKASAEL